MHLIETYSHYCGVKPSKPFIWEKYFSIPYDKYIVIQANAGMASKQYDYWEYVAENINIPIVQIGAESDIPLPVTCDLRGKTTWNESAYILKRASLFLGCDSICNHMASAFSIPRISLFGPTSSSSCGGYWKSNPATFELSPSDMQGCVAPCYHDKCLKPLKCINSIRPERILASIRTILGEDSTDKVEFLHFGPKAKECVLEWLPFTCGNEDFAQLRTLAGVLHIRSDLVGGFNFPEFIPLISSIGSQINFFAIPSIAINFNLPRERVAGINIMANRENVNEAIYAAKKLHDNMYPVSILVNNHEDFNDKKLEVLDFSTFASFSDSEPIPESLASFNEGCYTVSSARRIVGKNGNVFITRLDAINNTNQIPILQSASDINLTKQHLSEAHRLVIRKYGSKI